MTPKADAILTFGLVLANLAALTALVTPLRARLDLTEQREYTINDATLRVLRNLPDTVEVYGYFSGETHPKLKPLIPMIGDVLEEFRIRSEGKVLARMVDPKDDPIAEKEAYRRFSVRATPFPIETQYERGVKSAYFSLVVAFGEHSVRLDFGDLIEVQPGPNDSVVVKLRSLEYQLTSSIDKVVREFESLEMKLAEGKDPVLVELFVSEPERAPEGEARDLFTKKRKAMQEVVDELTKKYKAGFTAKLIDPEAEPGGPERVRTSYGLTPVRAQANGPANLWLDGVVRSGKKGERIQLRDSADKERGAGEVREAVEAAVRRLLPGAMRTVGIASNKPKLSPEEMMQYAKAGMEMPGDEYGQLRNTLKAGFKVVDVDLSSGAAPLDVDVLLVMKPRDWTTKHELALDQFLMYGGKAIVCVDQAELPQNARSFALSPVVVKADELLARYGVTVRKELVMDERHVPYPLQRWKDIGGLRIPVVEQLPYPWFLDIRGDSIDRSNPVVSGVEAASLLWANPITVDATKIPGVRVSSLLTTSDRAWTSKDIRTVEPKATFKEYGAPEKLGRETVAVSLEGKLPSAFKDRPEAVTGGAGAEPLLESPETTRLVVIGDSEFASDIAARISPSFKGNVQLVSNLIDWALANEDLIRIRSRGAADRPLAKLEPEEKRKLQLANYAVPIGLVLLFGLGRAASRRLSATKRVRPPSRTERGPGGKPGAAPEPVGAASAGGSSESTEGRS